MQHYQILRDMGKQVKHLYEKLHLQHDLLRSQNPDLVHSENNDSTGLSRQITARIEAISTWKYAPEPLKSLRSDTTGEPHKLCDPSTEELIHLSTGVKYLLASPNHRSTSAFLRLEDGNRTSPSYGYSQHSGISP